jgi:hypothetical protein
MPKIKLSFRPLPVPEKIAKVKQFVTALEGNANFPTPSPPLANILAAITKLEGSYANTQRLKAELKSSATEQNADEEVIDKLVSQLTGYIESAAGDNEALIHSLGMETRAARSAPTIPDVADGLTATAGDHDGHIDLSWNPVTNAKSYVIQISTDANSATSWTHALTVTKSSATIDGLTSGVRYWFRVAAIGSEGQGGWSDPATKIAP